MTNATARRDRIAAFARDWEDEYRGRTPASARLAVGPEAGRIPDSQRNYFNSGMPYPIYLDRGEGAYAFDIDGNRYVDWAAGWNSGVLGFGNERVAAAVAEAMRRYGGLAGEAFPSPMRDRLSALICERVPGAEQVIFCLTGAEANEYALRFARAFTGRTKILKFVGAYHGVYDELLAGTIESPGLTPDAAANVILATFNDRQGTARLIEQHAHELAAVITEPILTVAGNVQQRDGFLQFLRDETIRHGVLLILDEVITGFRFGMGGAAEYYGITPPPDLLPMAKMLGGGLPVAAVAGRRDVLGSGATAHNTHSSNPVTHAAAVAALEQLTPELYRQMNRLGARMRDGLREVFADLGLRIQVTGDGTNAGIHLVPVEVWDGETARRTDLQLFNLFRIGMLNRGMNWTTRGFGVTGAFSDDDVETTIAGFRSTALALRPLFIDVAPELVG
jgi:glutamate-1-semialdehyde 2,1-aminomutase